MLVANTRAAGNGIPGREVRTEAARTDTKRLRQTETIWIGLSVRLFRDRSQNDRAGRYIPAMFFNSKPLLALASIRMLMGSTKQAKVVSKVRQISFHRNGVSELGFHAVLFETDATCMGMSKNELMLATVFDERGAVAVVAVGALSTDVGVRFGENSWRGDHFEQELRDAIKDGKSDGSVRVGMFGIPTK